METEKKIIAALSEAINAPDRPPAFWHLPPVKYPVRQIQMIELSDSTWELRYYHRYKNRKPKTPLTNVAEIRAALNAALNCITVTAVEDNSNYISIYMEDLI